MSHLVTIYGGSGFVGRYIARRMAKEGWRVRVAVRKPNEALFVRTYGVVGQVEPVLCNVRNEASVASAIRGARAVVNCVGILSEVGKNTFQSIQAEAPGCIARAATQEGIERLVHISAIGADLEATSTYGQTKRAGEKVILSQYPQAVILRPSIIFGSEDQFFNRFAALTKVSGVLPIVGAHTRFQPVYVDDVAKAAVCAVLSTVEGGVYELGGPEIKTFRDLMQLMLRVIRRRRLIANVPFPIAVSMGFLFDILNSASFGMIPAQITRDQVRSLRRDNVVSDGAKGFADFGLSPLALEPIMEEYLWRFRPSGQYEKLKESAQSLDT